MTYQTTGSNRNSQAASGSFTVCGVDTVDIPLPFNPATVTATLGLVEGAGSGCNPPADTVSHSVTSNKYGQYFLHVAWTVGRPRALNWTAVP